VVLKVNVINIYTMRIVTVEMRGIKS